MHCNLSGARSKPGRELHLKEKKNYNNKSPVLTVETLECPENACLYAFVKGHYVTPGIIRPVFSFRLLMMIITRLIFYLKQNAHCGGLDSLRHGFQEADLFFRFRLF